jgi:lysophospholipase L1-like esterase
MFEVLCCGDSNIWGADPATGGRFSRDDRWPGVLQKALGDEYHVIEEGLGGRTTVWEDPIEGHKNGREYLIPCLVTHSPLDLVIILLGTNDLKKRFSVSAQDIAFGAGVLVDTVNKSGSGRNWKASKVLLLVPRLWGSSRTLTRCLREDARSPKGSLNTSETSQRCTDANSSIPQP